MQVMNILWNLGRGACVNDILEQYPDPKPAYTTIATFLKILTQKGFVEHKKGAGKLLIYTPLMTKEKYRRQIMAEVKDDFFGNSFKTMFSFFVKEEHLTTEEIEELLNQIKEEEKK
jgi:predicted transcriptional regulator